MAKRVAKKKTPQSFTFKGDDLWMVLHALEAHSDLMEMMLNDKDLGPEERGSAAFDLQHCRDLLASVRGGK